MKTLKLNTVALVESNTPFIEKNTGSIRIKSNQSKSLLACAVIGALITTPVMAKSEQQQRNNNSYISAAQKEQAKTNEEVGFGTGAIIGAVIAGPFGAFFAGIAGSLIAKHSNVIDERDNLTTALTSQKNNHQMVLENYQNKMQQVEQEYQSELLALQQSQHNTSQLQAENLLMSLQFPTGSSDLQPHYQHQIDSLATLLKQSTDLSIDLSGYTDLQGDEKLNHALSIARVNTVKHALINLGVSAERIKIFAFGENQPVVANAEKQVSFYDRRVVIKLSNDNHQMAQN
ncbi:sortase-associated OmpA-like protein PdsO [bacterium]|nr:sortase-associated OmpA-like protein PdsO [bacterium]